MESQVRCASRDLTCDSEDEIAKLFSEPYKKSHLSNFVVGKICSLSYPTNLRSRFWSAQKTVTSSLKQLFRFRARGTNGKESMVMARPKLEKKSLIFLSSLVGVFGCQEQGDILMGQGCQQLTNRVPLLCHWSPLVLISLSKFY